MQLSILAVSLFGTIAAAQSVTSTSFTSSSASSTSSAALTTSSCDAQPVLNQCLESTEIIANNCATNDYLCLCQKWQDVAVCFNNCPNDPGQTAISVSVSVWCSEASIYGTTTTITAASTTDSTSTTATTGSTQTSGSGASSTGSAASATSSNASSSSSSSGRGVNLFVGASTALVALAGVMGVFW